MSAIAGVYRLDGYPVEKNDLDHMSDSLAHRGCDGKGIWFDGPVGLVSRLFQTTPESHSEKLPRFDSEAGLAITADARLDNRGELIAALGLSTDRTWTDSALILEAYRKWGEGCPERLLGAFAFVIWDTQEQELFCARDHMGVKPFYYHHRRGNAFAFGSEIKALFCLKDIPRQLNETRVADYLLPILEDHEITLYRDVLRLPAAHSLTVSPKGIAIRRYWSLDPDREIRLKSDDEYTEAFREIFTEAVRCRLRGGVTIGSTLSGGLDSSSVACMARQLLAEEGTQELHTFSAVFDVVRESDEREYIQAALDQGGLQSHFVHPDRLSPFVDIDRIQWHLDGATQAPNMFIHWEIYRSANEAGCRIILDGLDGDTTVSHGIPFLCELFRKGHWVRLAREARLLGKTFSSQPAKIVWRRAIKPMIPTPVRRLRRLVRGETGALQTTNPVLHPDFIRRIDLMERERVQLKGRLKAYRSVREEHYVRLTSALLPFVMELADHATAAFRLEARYPFFDKRLIEFCLALPGGQRLKDGLTRHILRRGLKGTLPEKIRWRPSKSDLSPNFRRSLSEHGRKTLDDVILGDPAVLEPFVNIGALRRVYEHYKTDRGNDEAMYLWRAVNLALWLRAADFENTP